MSMLWAGLLVGVAGSAHCVLMCGPLAALAAPRGLRAVVYHSSRLLTYAVLGAGAGFAGSAIAQAGAGRILTVAVALVLLVQAWAGWHGRAPSGAGKRLTKLLSSGVQAWRRIAGRHPLPATLGVGVINGLLPCGLVYAALAASSAQGGPAQGAVFMAAFGAGTVPLVAAAAGAANLIRLRLPGLNRLAPAALVIVALLLAVRSWSALVGGSHVH